MYELDPVYFLSAPWLAWQPCLKKTGVKLELLTDINMLMMVEKGLRDEIWHAIHRYAKEIISTWKIMIKILNHYISCIWMQTICMDARCLKNCPKMDDRKWKKS